MKKPFLLDVVTITIAFIGGVQLMEVSLEDSFAGASQTELVDFTVKRLIFLMLGIGLIGYGLTKSLFRIRAYFTTERR